MLKKSVTSETSVTPEISTPLKPALEKPVALFQSVFVAWLLLDFAVKQVVVGTMELGQSIPLWPDVFHLTFVRNTGAAFSLLQGQYWVFYLAMALLIVLVALFWWKERPNRYLPVISTALVLAGATGNLVDRLTSGSVVDIFDITLINFAVFNVADVGITFGCIAFLYWAIIMGGLIVKKDKPPVVENAEEPESADEPEATPEATDDADVTERDTANKPEADTSKSND